mmetsp:Transcript_353/g.1027  ORF Transcript_353/g.1027 Transcript_353/m.1027 type:complete len:357 (-) Transcript_353:389-1459(-)
MEKRLKQVKSERALPVELAPDDDEISILSGLEPTRVGHASWSSLAAEVLGSLRDLAAEALGAAQEVGSAAKECVGSEVWRLRVTLRASASTCVGFAAVAVTGTAEYVRGQASAGVGLVRRCCAEVLGGAQAVQATALACAAALQGALKDVREKGMKATAAEGYGSLKRQAADRGKAAVDFTKASASGAAARARSLAADRQLQATAASAAGGAVALGASGGATGLAAGGALGAAIGLVPALFTFGLSIPVGAALGAGTGLVVGTAVGGTVGAVGAGAAGYGAYSKREEIGKCAGYVKGKAAASTGFIKEMSSAALERALERTNEAADFTKAQVHASAGYMRTRLAGRCGTGGTGATD